ncbi:MAG: hypothetical protein HGA38_03595 [Candidatus Moranbacteria bacterium]|nr:hypothetical protein [Candidatus Moranbacteria bacterium]
MPLHPFSDDIVFLDAEFTSLDPYTGEILSVALVKPDGSEFYLEIDRDPGTLSPWVAEHVLPFLDGPRVAPDDAVIRIRDFVGADEPFPVSFVTPYDTVFLRKLVPESAWPFRRYPIDFAALLFASGLDPANLLENDRILSEKIGVAPSEHRRMHHALNDAQLLRDAYGKFFRYLAD